MDLRIRNEHGQRIATGAMPGSLSEKRDAGPVATGPAAQKEE